MSDDPITKKVQIDLEVDTAVTNSAKHPFYVHLHQLAKVIDSWRIFPRLFIGVYIYLFFESTMWFMALKEPTIEQAGLITVITSMGAAWFALYVSTGKKKDDN